MVPRAPRLVHLGATSPEQLARRRSAGSAWARDSASRYYLHSFYPEQPDLDWRNPEVVAAMQDVVRFWLERGADGFRIDAIDRLLKDPRAARRPAGHRAVRPAAARGRGRARAHCTRATRPTSATALAAIREAAGDALPRRRGLPAEPRAGSPTSSTSTRSFAFELLHSPWEADAAARGDRGDARASPAPPGCCRTTTSAAWPRASARENARAAAMLLLTLPGPGVPLPGRRDRAGATARRASRASTAPAATASATRCSGTRSPHGGFTAGEPWLPLVDPASATSRTSATTRARCCRSCRELIALRRELGRRLRAARRGRRAWSPSGAATTWWRSTRRRSRARAARAASRVLQTARRARCGTACSRRTQAWLRVG